MSYSFISFIFLVFCLAQLSKPSLSLDTHIEERDLDCNKAKRCKSQGEPAVRFPFRLRDHHPPHCGHPDPHFELSCNRNKNTVLNFSRTVFLFVKSINYSSQEIAFHDPINRCLPQLLLDIPDLNVSASPFRYIEMYSFLSKHMLFNCSLPAGNDENNSLDSFDHYVPCLSKARGYGVRSVDETSSVLSLVGCQRIYFPLPVFVMYSLFEDNLLLNWSEPNCMKCERGGRGCRLMESDVTRTECFELPKKSTGEKRRILIMTGAIIGSFLLIVASIGIYCIHHSCKVKRKHEIKIKQFLEDYKALKSTRYTYADIWRITNQFNQKLGQGGFGTVYKGKLSNNILVAVKMLNHNSTGSNGDEFINEVASMGTIHHVNVARLVGFCVDGPNRALVFEFLPNGSLEKFIFSENEEKKVVLGWERLQDIALGIAKGVEYLHHGCEQQILHFDIKPHNILLDRDFVPKISDFGLAKLCAKEKSVVTMTAARGTMGYIAPEVASRNFGKPSGKSDVYSFGMLLLEMVGGRRNLDANVENSSQVYFPEWVYTHFDQLGHPEIAKKLAIVALWCVQWNPMDRPSMKVVVQMLEGDGDNLTMPPNPFCSGDGTKIAAKPSRPLNVALDIISEIE